MHGILAKGVNLKQKPQQTVIISAITMDVSLVIIRFSNKRLFWKKERKTLWSKALRFVKVRCHKCGHLNLIPVSKTYGFRSL